ncbi:MAG: hypothetical protein KDA52_16670, partial [Planctomycetaceae bacterium]|nr:hypothetical protein [Planctomycetaceae bacterium]
RHATQNQGTRLHGRMASVFRLSWVCGFENSAVLFNLVSTVVSTGFHNPVVVSSILPLPSALKALKGKDYFSFGNHVNLPALFINSSECPRVNVSTHCSSKSLDPFSREASQQYHVNAVAPAVHHLHFLGDRRLCGFTGTVFGPLGLVLQPHPFLDISLTPFLGSGLPR